jgi:hypothetical protein
MTKDNKKRVEWFLRLINSDFRDGFPQPNQSLFQDMQRIFGRSLHPDLASLNSVQWNPELAEAQLREKAPVLKRLQKSLEGFLTEALDKINDLRKYQGKDGIVLDKATPSELIELRALGQFTVPIRVRLILHNPPKLERNQNNKDRWIAYWPDNTLDNSPIESDIIPEEGDSGFLFAFAQALNGIYWTNIRRCTECRAWFLQSGKRERIFCSGRCRVKNYKMKKRDQTKKQLLPDPKEGMRRIRIRKKEE